MEKVEEILSLISSESLKGLASIYGVNKHNTKITGELILEGLMRLILSGKKTSLRMLEAMINQTNILQNKSVTHSGISKRLKVINYRYFEGIYKDLIGHYSKIIDRKAVKDLYRFDSTIINLSGYMIKDGIKVGGKSKDSQVKVSIGLKNSLPMSIRFCDKQEDSSEDAALVKAINEAKVEKEDVLLFDRGISKTSTFVDFEERDYKFVTRVNTTRKYKIIKSNELPNEQTEGSLILEDAIVNIYAKPKRIPFPTKFRLIKLLNKDGNEIWFLSNLFDIPALELTELYRRRWDIEVFFKFVKQNLGYKHFLNHTMNGMKVYIYTILITSIIFLMYKEKNKLQGFKVALFKFSMSVDKLFIKHLIIISGGDFDAVKHLF